MDRIKRVSKINYPNNLTEVVDDVIYSHIYQKHPEFTIQ